MSAIIPALQEVEAGGPGVQDHPWPHSKSEVQFGLRVTLSIKRGGGFSDMAGG